MSFQEKYNEYKERQEAKKYFRSNNDQFLDVSQWVKTIGFGIIGAVVMGVVHCVLTLKLGMDFSLFYLIIGYAMANIVTSASGVQSKSVAYASVGLTFLTFYISMFTSVLILMSFTGVLDRMFIYAFPAAFETLFNGGLFDLIFMVIGLFVSYQQAQ